MKKTLIAAVLLIASCKKEGPATEREISGWYNLNEQTGVYGGVWAVLCENGRASLWTSNSPYSINTGVAPFIECALRIDGSTTIASQDSTYTLYFYKQGGDLECKLVTRIDTSVSYSYGKKYREFF